MWPTLCDPDECQNTERFHWHSLTTLVHSVFCYSPGFGRERCFHIKTWMALKKIWYCCQVNKCCSVKLRQLHHSNTHHVCLGTLFAERSNDLFCYCPWHTYCGLAHMYVFHPFSLPLVVGHVLHAFSMWVWPVLVWQLYLEGHTQRFSCNEFLGWWSRINALIKLALTLKLIMVLWCCFFSRDCGGSGKRKSGKDLKTIYFCQYNIYWSYSIALLMSMICDFVVSHLQFSNWFSNICTKVLEF